MHSITTLLLVLLANMTFGQMLSPGYIVKTSGDTLVGFIREGGDAALRREIAFAKTRDGHFDNYFPGDLSAVRFNYGRNFVSISNLRNAKPGEEKLFAKKIVEGKMNFYSVGSDSYLFSKGDTLNCIVVPPVVKEVVDEHGVMYTPKSLEHIREISRLVEDSPASLRRVGNLKYSYSKFRDLTIDYDKEFAGKYPITIYKSKKRINLRLMVGTGLSNPGGVQYQVGLFSEVTNIEKNPNLSILSGIVFNSWDSQLTTFVQGETLYKEQYVAFYPIGLNLQSNPARVRVYGHVDFGLYSSNSMSYALRSFDQITGGFVTTFSTAKATNTLFFNAAVGAKVKVGEHAILVEVGRTFGKVASGNSVMLNIGFSY